MKSENEEQCTLIEANLCQLGFSQREAKVYLTCYSYQQLSIAAISNQTGIKRPTCYLIVEELIENGYLYEVLKQGKKLFAPIDPTLLVSRATENLKKAQEVVSTLQTLRISEKQKPVIRAAYNQKSIQELWEHMLYVGVKEIYYFGPIPDIVESVGEEFLLSYIEKRIALGIHAYGIRSQEEKVDQERYKAGVNNLRHVYVPPPSVSIKNIIFTYDKYVLLISKSKDYFALLIENEHLAETVRSFFDSIKALSKEIVD